MNGCATTRNCLFRFGTRSNDWRIVRAMLGTRRISTGAKPALTPLPGEPPLRRSISCANGQFKDKIQIRNPPKWATDYGPKTDLNFCFQVSAFRIISREEREDAKHILLPIRPPPPSGPWSVVPSHRLTSLPATFAHGKIRGNQQQGTKNQERSPDPAWSLRPMR